MAAGANNATAVKLLQEMAPKLETVLTEQEQLRDQVKHLRMLLLIVLFLSLVLPFYFARHDVSTCSSFEEQSCSVPPAPPSP